MDADDDDDESIVSPLRAGNTIIYFQMLFIINLNNCHGEKHIFFINKVPVVYRCTLRTVSLCTIQRLHCILLETFITFINIKPCDFIAFAKNYFAESSN